MVTYEFCRRLFNRFRGSVEKMLTHYMRVYVEVVWKVPLFRRKGIFRRIAVFHKSDRIAGTIEALERSRCGLSDFCIFVAFLLHFHCIIFFTVQCWPICECGGATW